MTFNEIQARDQADAENEFVSMVVAGYLMHHKLQVDRDNAVGICRDVLCNFNSKYLPASEQAELIVKAAGIRHISTYSLSITKVITDARAQFRAYAAGVRYV